MLCKNVSRAFDAYIIRDLFNNMMFEAFKTNGIDYKNAKEYLKYVDYSYSYMVTHDSEIELTNIFNGYYDNEYTDTCVYSTEDDDIKSYTSDNYVYVEIEEANNFKIVKLKGKGLSGKHGGENGDLYIEFLVEEHKYFVRNQDDIYHPEQEPFRNFHNLQLRQLYFFPD